jgi:hypothetical protein
LSIGASVTRHLEPLALEWRVPADARASRTILDWS